MTHEAFLKKVEGTKFHADLHVDTLVNGNPMSIGYWNLIISIRDCKLYSKGIKPNRFWKIGDVKWYFGVKGNAEAIAKTLEEYQKYLTE
jgi:hypothetical protein